MYIYVDLCERFACEMCGTCCRNSWQVTLDETSYRRNAALFSSTGRKAEFDQAFIRLNEAAGYGEYAYIAKQAGGGCWFLDECNCCRLHKEAGHSQLDAICQIYPRYPMSTSRGIELTLSFSCPAVLKLADREAPLVIKRGDQPPIAFPENNYAVEIYPQQQPAWEPLHYYFELETHFIDILQCRNLQLTERLELLTNTVKAINELPQNETLARELTALYNRNYDWLEKLAADRLPLAAGMGEFLLENFFVSFIFRKPFYLYGLEKTLLLLERMWQQMSNTKDIAAAIMQFEFQYSHNRQAWWR